MRESNAAPAPGRLKDRPRHRRRHQRPRITVGRVVGGLILAALMAGFAVVAVGVGSRTWQIQPILSGSMRPGFPIGGVVVAQRVPTSSLQVRDVILFHPPAEATKTYVHRIVSLKHVDGSLVITTQGDDNRFPDPWTLRLKGRWAYEARFTVPVVGYAAVWSHSTTGRTVLLLTAGALIVVCGILIMGGQALAHRRSVPLEDGVESTDVSSEVDPRSG